MLSGGRWEVVSVVDVIERFSGGRVVSVVNIFRRSLGGRRCCQEIVDVVRRLSVLSGARQEFMSLMVLGSRREVVSVVIVVERSLGDR